MNLKRIRPAIPVVVFVLLSLGLVFNHGTGTLSAFGWRDISLLCPLGALTSMLAAKTLVPRAVFALLAVVAIVVLTGRAFCSWACPVPFVSKLRDAFRLKSRSLDQLQDVQAQLQQADTTAPEDAPSSSPGHLPGASTRQPAFTQLEGQASEAAASQPADPRTLPASHATAKQPALTQAEQDLLRGGTEAGCAACTQRLSRVDSRHLVLGGAVLSAAVFGFPVFCLVCPIGLAFGTVLLLVALFGYGDATWSVLLVPALLLAEVVFFRKWCSKICPLGAFLSLVGKANRTALPSIDTSVCLETTKDVPCATCTKSCEQGINLRDPSLGASRSECTRCLACVHNCPTHAIHISPVLRDGR